MVRLAWMGFLMGIAGCGGRLGVETKAEGADSAVVDSEPDIAFHLPPEPDVPVLAALELVPYRETLFIDAGKPAGLAFKAQLHRDDGTASDVTAGATFSLEDASLGAMSGPVFTSAPALPGTRNGRSTRVFAQYGEWKTLALLDLVQLDSKMDLFFKAPCCGATTPSRSVLHARSGTSTLDLSLDLTIEAGRAPLTPASFLKSVRAMSEGDLASGCAARPAKDADGDGIEDTFPAVPPSTTVCFEVIPSPKRPVSVMDTEFFSVFAELTGMPGAAKLGRHTMVFAVSASGCCDGK